MIWTIISDDANLKIESNFADGVFQQEHPTLKVTSKNSIDVLLIIGSAVVADYIPDANNMVYIDLTDYFSTIPIGIGAINELKVATPISQAVSISYDVKGLRNPQHMSVPQLFSGLISESASIVFPTKWLMPLFGLNDRVELYRNAEVLPNNADRLALYFTTSYPYVNREDDLQYGLVGSYEIPTDLAESKIGLKLYCNFNVLENRFVIRQSLMNCKQYASVEWLSRTGAKKRHTWEVRDVKDKVFNAVDFVTRFNGYKVNKGYEQTIVLHLDNLTRYDYWYYSDLITSSDVRVALNEVDADFDDSTLVEVQSNSVEVPNANGMYELNVEIKYKRYDRV
jgi:hypothetical protein